MRLSGLNYPDGVFRGRRSGASALVLLALALAACGGGVVRRASDSVSTGVGGRGLVLARGRDALQARPAGRAAAGATADGQAPQIVLHDQNGKLFKLSSLRGKAVYLTFVYSHCPDVCPLMMQAPRRRPALAARPVEHADRRRLGRSQGRHPEGGQGVPARAPADRQGDLAARHARAALAGLDRVQHPRQVGARDARDHRARLADLRHRRQGPHPRRLSGLAAQARPGSRTTPASSRARSDRP